MARRLDGAPEESAFDSLVASLCQSKSRTKQADLVPSFVQVGPATVDATLPAGAGAVYLTDEDGTIVGHQAAGLGSSGPAGARAGSLALDFKGSPLRLTLHVHLPETCRTVHSAPTGTWRTILDEFNYMGSGGVVPNSSRWDEPTLQRSAPTLRLLPSPGAATRAAQVSMLQQPGLPVPLLFVACSTSTNEPLLLRLFTGPPRADHEAHGAMGAMGAHGDAGWWVQTPTNFSATFDVPPKCYALRACGAMPDGAKEGCGGPGPRRCTQLDLIPQLVAEIEATHPPAVALPAGDVLERRTRDGVVLRLSPQCEAAAARSSGAPAVLYARAAGSQQLLAFGAAKAQLNVNLPPGVRKQGVEVHAYQLCNGSLTSATFEVSATAAPPPPLPVLRAAVAASAPPPLAPHVQAAPDAAAAAVVAPAFVPTVASAGMTVGACLALATVMVLLLGTCLGVVLSRLSRGRRCAAVQVDDSHEKEALRGDADEPTPGAFGGVLAANVR